MSEVATTTTRALARREAALAAFEALTGWTPTVEITVDAEGRVTRLRMEARTRLSPNASARVIRAHMDHLGRCMMEVEAEVDPQGSTLRQRQQTLGAPLPILLHRRKPEGPRHMLKLVAQYAADNPVGAMHPTRLDVLAVAALLLLP